MCVQLGGWELWVLAWAVDQLKFEFGRHGSWVGWFRWISVHSRALCSLWLFPDRCPVQWCLCVYVASTEPLVPVRDTLFCFWIFKLQSGKSRLYIRRRWPYACHWQYDAMVWIPILLRLNHQQARRKFCGFPVCLKVGFWVEIPDSHHCRQNCRHVADGTADTHTHTHEPWKHPFDSPLSFWKLSNSHRFRVFPRISAADYCTVFMLQEVSKRTKQGALDNGTADGGHMLHAPDRMKFSAK
jgi:hypothetical protein